MVQRDLAEIGVDMQLESVPVRGFQSEDRARDFDAVMMEFISGSSPSRPFTFWHSHEQAEIGDTATRRLMLRSREFGGLPNETEYRDAFRRFQVEDARRSSGNLPGLRRNRASSKPTVSSSRARWQRHSA